MSKNFELLQNISNEKDLFQALDRWEDTDEVSVNAGPGTESGGKTRVGTQRQSALPDVFQAIDNSLGPFDLVPPELSRGVETVQEQAREPLEEKAQAETQSTTFESRFPISRNPVTPLNSVLDIPQAWVKPEILPRPNDEVELQLDPETPPSVAVPHAPPASEKVTGPSDAKVQGRSPAKKEEKTRHEPPSRRAFTNFGVEEGNSIDESRARKSQTRNAYRDPRCQAIAREEELKLVQRIFLAKENAPRIVLFSGLERDTGCASICIRAGEILASQGDGSVCLVDMGFRVPSLHEYCGVPNDRGLAEAMADSNPIQEFAQQLSPANLWAIPSGHGATQMNFATVADRVRARMEELRKAFRYVVIHSESLWLNADAMLISKWTDGVVLILEAHSTRRDTARRIKESLAVANTRVLGVVLNNRTYPIPETLYSRL
jgi:Mrp family chromosome partitioning ATPase